MTDRAKIVFLAKKLGTHEQSTLVYEYIAARRFKFNSDGEIVDVRYKEYDRYMPGGGPPPKKPGKLDMNDADNIRLLKKNGSSTIDIAEKYGVDRSTIRMIVNNKMWKHDARR